MLFGWTQIAKCLAVAMAIASVALAGEPVLARPAISIGSVIPETTSAMNLRGLGTPQTLILIDARLAATVTMTGTEYQPDLNGIPLSAIERIEVLPATASGIYSGGATGGVVNVVLRRDYSGIDARASYGNTFTGRGALIDSGVSGVFLFTEGRTSILFGGSYPDAEPLSTVDREFSSDRSDVISELELAVRGPAMLSMPWDDSARRLISTPATRLAKAPTPILGMAAQGLSFDIASAGTRHAGAASDGGAALIANAGKYNLDLAVTASTSGVLAIPELQRREQFNQYMVDRTRSPSSSSAPFPRAVEGVHDVDPTTERRTPRLDDATLRASYGTGFFLGNITSFTASIPDNFTELSPGPGRDIALYDCSTTNPFHQNVLASGPASERLTNPHPYPSPCEGEGSNTLRRSVYICVSYSSLSSDCSTH